MEKTTLQKILDDIEDLNERSSYSDLFADLLDRALKRYGSTMDQIFVCRCKNLLHKYDPKNYSLDDCLERASK